MSTWLANPKKFAPGTKMTFAGLSNPQDRADVMLFLNSRDNAPLAVPPPPAPAEAEAGAEATDANAAAPADANAAEPADENAAAATTNTP
jgi:cytochrome c